MLNFVTDAFTRQFGEIVNKVLRSPRQGKERGAMQAPWANPLHVAKTTSVVGAISGSTVGTGTAAIYEYDGSGLTAVGVDDFDVLNMGAEIASGTWIMITQSIQGYWWVTVEDCG